MQKIFSTINVLEVTGDEIKDFHQRVLTLVRHLRLLNGSHQTIHYPGITHAHTLSFCLTRPFPELGY